MRRLFAVLVVLALLVVGADFALKFLGEYWVARELQAKLELSTRPDVSLEGFPFIPHLISGEFDEVRLRSGPSEVKGIELEAVELDLRQVRFSSRQLVAGGEATIRGEEGDGHITLTGRGVTEALNRANIPLRVRFVDGQVGIGSPQLGIEGRAELSTSGGRLVLTPAGFPRIFSFPLPELVPGVDYTTAEVRGEEAEVAFSVDKPTFEVST
ncbi:MAG TPA: DUF2993 domain-containing protein [Actinomycetota bacterium]|nr:DUF2993 domain-containing protein [Actinomycetota bacterium]